MAWSVRLNAGAITNGYYDYQTTGQTQTPADGSVAMTTTALQGTLPSGFSTSAWSTGQGLYPYLTNFFPNGVQAISGIAYSDAGLTGAAGASVTAIGDGNVLGSASAGANGYYYIMGAAGSFAGGKGYSWYSTA